jgi:hypothetical protein
MVIVAAMPIRGRIPLVRSTVHRLAEMGIKTAAVVTNIEEAIIVREAGGIAETSGRMELGLKWNKCYELAKKLKPDAVLHIGSDDWITPDWIDTYGPWLADYDIVGTMDYHFTHFNFGIKRSWDGYPISNSPMTVNVCYWPGYDLKEVPHRENEPIGGGRLIRASFLDYIGWKPFNDCSVKNLDFEMIKKCQQLGGAYMGFRDTEAKSLSITTNLWPSKNGYKKMIQNGGQEIGPEFLDKYFPDIWNLWKW